MAQTTERHLEIFAKTGNSALTFSNALRSPASSGMRALKIALTSTP